MGTSVKTATLTEEIVRRLKHTSQRLECSSRLETLEEATQKMINSGHRNSFIERIMIQGIVKYERMVKRSKLDETEQGYRILHQPSGRCSVRLRKKVMARENWFKPKPREDDDIETKKCGNRKRVPTQRAGEEEKVRTTTVMFLQSTKGEILLKRMNENEGNMSQLLGFRVKYAEAGGIQQV